jgi:hemerythrin HHE cation binding domain-containing protein
MKRTPELAPLSRDHHVALEHALRLRRASTENAATAVAAFLAFLVDDGRAHFAQEEALLVPVVPPDRADLAKRMLDEHEEILHRATALGKCPEAAHARELGELLSRHVRFEERELFPLLEHRLPAKRLIEIGRDLMQVR